MPCRVVARGGWSVCDCGADQAWVVERMGRYSHVMAPGLNLLLPVVDRVKYVQNLKEQAIDIPQQSAITAGEAGGSSQ